MEALTGTRVYLDANVFIYFLDRYPPLTAVVDRLFSLIVSHDVEAVTGQLAVAEVMVGVYRTAEPTAIERAHGFFRTSGMTSIIGHDADAFDVAARLRADRGVPFVDAIHMATALGAGCRYLITNDACMPSIDGLEIVRLQDLEELPG